MMTNPMMRMTAQGCQPRMADAMGDLLKHRKARMASGKKEKEALVACIQIWKKNKLRAYEYDDRNYVLKESEKIVVEQDDDED